MPDPQHHGTLLICWTNYCAVLCLGVVVMCVCVVIVCVCVCVCVRVCVCVFFVFMPCQGPCYFNLVPLSLAPIFSCMLSYFHDVIIIIIGIDYGCIFHDLNFDHVSAYFMHWILLYAFTGRDSRYL